MKRALLRIGGVAAAGSLLLGIALFAPLGLRALDGFRVRHVELIGGHHLTAREAADAAGITMLSNIFDDPAPWLESLRRHPLVADARIERRVPETIVISIREAEPIAFARTPELRPIDERGRVLPADPAEDMDLPVLAIATRIDSADAATDEATLRLVRFIADVERLQPALLDWVSEVGVAGDAVRLVLRNAADAEVLLPAAPSAARLRELHVTLADLAEPRRVAASDSTNLTPGSTTELSRVKRIDGRFHDQIVVAMHGRN